MATWNGGMHMERSLTSSFAGHQNFLRCLFLMFMLSQSKKKKIKRNRQRLDQTRS